MWNSGIRRPAGNRLREFLPFLDAGAGMGNEIGHERGVFLALRDGDRPGNQLARPDAGQTAEPGKLHLVVAERCDRRRIGFHGDVFHIHAEFRGKIGGNLAKPLAQLGLVLIGNRGKDETVGGEGSRLVRQRHREQRSAYEQ
jgi:hypothetical protein